MSLDAAIGQIDQILTLRQQLLDPASAASAASSTTSTADTASADSSAFADMLAQAQGSDALTDPSAALTASALGESDTTTTGLTDPITSGVTDPILSTLTGSSSLGATTATTMGSSSGGPGALTAMVQEANSLIGKPYVWGGGHGGWGPQAGYDCSGFVSAVLHAGGYLSSPQDTQTLPSQPGILQGPGQYVTIYDRTDGADGGDHVIIDLGGQFYESGGGHGAWGGGGGVEKIATPSQAYLDSFNLVLHPEGL